jgi:hypothetical protein
MKSARQKCVVVAILASFVSATPALAITAQDVMQKMTQHDRYNYLTGLIDMRTYIAAQAGNGTMAKCIFDTYYADGKAAWAKLTATLLQYPDKQATTIVHSVTQTACGK